MTGSEIKSVKYNEDLFKIPSGTQKRKKAGKPPIKIKPVTNKTIKNKILDEIRKNQERHYKSLVDEAPIDKSKCLSNKGLFDNDFQKSVEFLQTFADKHKEETKLNKTIKSSHMGIEPINTNHVTGGNNTFSEIYTSPLQKVSTPSYGCLKNGNLPTYRNLCNRTLKNQVGESSINVVSPLVSSSSPLVSLASPLVPSSSPLVPSPSPLVPLASPLVPSSSPITGTLAHNGSSGINEQPQQKSIAERIKSPTELLLIEKVKQKAESTKPKPINKKIKKILRRTYRTGKDQFRPRVSVLLPNKTIRRNVTTKSYLLKQTPIEEIRKTLLKQGFIKVGSSAPNDVLRKMYESVQMIGGEINNHNPDNLLYNFFNDKGKN
jgi:hypothetical protein